jgi:beta-glucosidase
LLDGDLGFWRGVATWARDGYNRVPIVAGAIARLGLPGLRFTDGPRGVTLGRSTCFPVAMARGATWDPALEAEIGGAIGREARAQGANLFGGVCVNVLRHPAWGRAQETYGEDPLHVGAMGAAAVRGVRGHVMACVKHLALNSIENARFVVDVAVDDDVLHEVYLPQFRAAITAGADAVMTAYNAVNGTWCGEHAALLTGIVRGEWRFAGCVISDFVWGVRDPIASLRAGLDVEMPFRQQRAAAVPAALADGRLVPTEVDRAAAHVIATQLRFAAEARGEVPARDVVACEAHRALARRAAAEAMVLLRNEAAALPIAPSSVARIAVIGRLATAANLGDRGSSNVHPPSTCSPLDGLAAVLPVIHDDGRDPARAAAVAAGADAAIVVVGYRDVDEGEYLFAVDDRAMQLLPWPLSTRVATRAAQWLARRFERRGGASGGASGGDRRDLRLRAADEALLAAVAAANPRTVAVVIAGSAVDLSAWRDRVAAIVLAWYPGMEGGRALADVITGAAEPGGRLPFAIAACDDDLPAFDREARAIRYDRWYGYRKLDRDGRAPAFPFGFGLGYTTWSLAELVVGDARAEVRVTNTGTRDGATVIQLYAIAATSGDRPARQLVGFARISLAAGATAALELAWSAQPLSRRDGAGRWSVVPGRYRFEAGRWLGDPDAAVAERTLAPQRP